VDAVIEVDLSGNAASYPQVLRPHGCVVVYGMAQGAPVLPGIWMMYNHIDIRFVFIYGISDEDRRDGIAGLTRMLEQGVLRHTIARHLPLAQASQAHEVVEQGQLMGNVVLDIPA